MQSVFFVFRDGCRYDYGHYMDLWAAKSRLRELQRNCEQDGGDIFEYRIVEYVPRGQAVQPTLDEIRKAAQEGVFAAFSQPCTASMWNSETGSYECIRDTKEYKQAFRPDAFVTEHESEWNQ